MEVLQIIWFVLIVFLFVGYAVLDGFDLGSGFWQFFAKSEGDRDVIAESVKPYWDGNEVWLLTGGGALFAAFPPVYATVFSGFYFAMLAIVVGLIFRAVALEFRDKFENGTCKRRWDFLFASGSTIPALLFGVALGNLLQGIPLDAAGNYTGSFVDLLNPYSLLLGICGLMMLAIHGGIFLLLKKREEELVYLRCWVRTGWYPYMLVLLLTYLFTFTLRKYLVGWPQYFIAMFGLIALLGVKSFLKKDKRKFAFICSAAGIVLNMLMVATMLFPNLVISTTGEGLTIYNASSSAKTLSAMLVMAFVGMPVVLWYTAFIYRIFSKRTI